MIHLKTLLIIINLLVLINAHAKLISEHNSENLTYKLYNDQSSYCKNPWSVAILEFNNISENVCWKNNGVDLEIRRYITDGDEVTFSESTHLDKSIFQEIKEDLVEKKIVEIIKNQMNNKASEVEVFSSEDKTSVTPSNGKSVRDNAFYYLRILFFLGIAAFLLMTIESLIFPTIFLSIAVWIGFESIVICFWVSLIFFAFAFKYKLTQKHNLKIAYERDCENRNIAYENMIREGINKVKNIIENHKDELKARRKQTTFKLAYGLEDNKKWQEEKKLFIEKVLFAEYTLLGLEDAIASRFDFNLAIDEISTDYSNAKYDFSNDMDPYDYEHFVCDELISLGWESEVTKASGDQGADVIAYQNGVSIAIQCKLYKGLVGNDAVQQVIAGKIFYNTDFGVVVTNSDFTKSARQIATTSGVFLLHHDQLNILNQLVNKDDPTPKKVEKTNIKRKWEPKTAMVEALKYNSNIEMLTYDKNLFDWLKKNKLSWVIGAHYSNDNINTYKSYSEIAKNSPNLKTLIKQNPEILYWAEHNGYFDEIIKIFNENDSSSHDAIYIWKASGIEFNEKPVYQIGITSYHLNNEQIQKFSKEANINFETIILQKVLSPKMIESQVLQCGESPYLGDFETYEFRAFTNKELEKVIKIIDEDKDYDFFVNSNWDLSYWEAKGFDLD
jgi:restriction system protein